jgi:sulfate permease, SulP family
MIVAITTVDWHSVRPSTLRRMPVPETLVMAVTIVVVVATGNLAIGVLVGVVLEMVLFARRVAHVIGVTREVSGTGEAAVARYAVHGPLFFGSSNDLVERFEYADDPPTVVIDFGDSQIWDASSVAALDSVVTKYRQHGIEASIEGLDGRSSLFHGRLSGHLG